jgi:hypothetical protein
MGSEYIFNLPIKINVLFDECDQSNYIPSFKNNNNNEFLLLTTWTDKEKKEKYELITI